jgi:prepilin-type N-terminal cleavage/methylation domain-containing protein
MRRLISNQHGMTLAEVLVALPIITIGLLALLSAIPLSTYAIQDGSQTSTATFLANQRLDQVRNAQWSAQCQVVAGVVVAGPAIVSDKVGVSTPSTAAPQDPTAVVTFPDESPIVPESPSPILATSYAGYSRQVRITDSVAAAPVCNAAGVMSGTGMRVVTVTVTYTPLSATGKNAVSGSRSVAVSMQIAQR